MPILRLTQYAELQTDHYRVEVSLEGIGARRATSVSFPSTMTDRDREDVRWYLETYLQYPQDPNPQRATGIEKRLEELGTTLFNSIFTHDAYKWWVKDVQGDLGQTRIEVAVTDPTQATALPWELLRDPETGSVLALSAQAFVRAHAAPVVSAFTPQAADTRSVRILLVICRPRLGEDVAFRSVAGQIVRGLTDEAREQFQLDVLRPPTFAQLKRVLDEAHKAGQPYHIVHFDGHGMFANLQTQANIQEWLRKLIPLMLAGPREGKHGYLLFENPALPDNVELVDGPTLGRTLRDAGVPVLVLNACRSAHAESPDAPQPNDTSTSADDTHNATRAFGSLAQEVMDAGVGGVVAMRYNVFVVTAAQFVADLYNALAQGQALGEAVSAGRKQLHAQPQREIAFKRIALQDWQVPVVYEAAPLKLFQNPRAQGGRAGLSLAPHARADALLPPPPDVDFVGRDETLLALDRAFDTQAVVLLHAYAGSGKTTTAAEFARWYESTGGLGEQGKLLFTSFERYTPLPRALDMVGRVFDQTLQANGIHWNALDDDQRAQLAIQIFQQTPVLWVWDNVEPVAGFPAGTASAWSADEQRALTDFLRRAIHNTKVKFLLTSRRDERAWLGDLPRRIQVPPLPMQERAQLARNVADKLGHRLTEVEDWLPLLRFSQGNPMTLTVVVRQALTSGVYTKAQVADFVRVLRQREIPLADEQHEGRDKSLSASLSYGFENAFSENERRVIALLHLFQGFVEVRALDNMGNSKFAEWVNAQPGITEHFEVLPELANMSLVNIVNLLNRVADIGLLTKLDIASYAIHPALPWYFGELYRQYWPEEKGQGNEVYPSPVRAYVEALGELGDSYNRDYGAGERSTITLLAQEEFNLLHTRTLARQHGWWYRVISAMQGLRSLYKHTGRQIEWKRLVDEIVPDFIDPTTDMPIEGQEERWSIVTQYRVLIAQENRQWVNAERWERMRVDWARRAATAALTFLVNGKDINLRQRNQIQVLAVSIDQLGTILREQAKPDCVKAYEEAIKIYRLIGAKTYEAVIALSLSSAYLQVPSILDLNQSEKWGHHALDLASPEDNLTRTNATYLLGIASFERFKEAQSQEQPREESLKYLNSALDSYDEALKLCPKDAKVLLANIHNQLGNIKTIMGDVESALYHYNEAISRAEEAQVYYQAAIIRRDASALFFSQGRFREARLYVKASLQGFTTYGVQAEEEVKRTKELLTEIDKRIASQNG